MLGLPMLYNAAVQMGNEDCLINVRDRLKSLALRLRDVSKQEITGMSTR